MRRLATISHAQGELYANALDALADGTITARERARVRAEAIKTIAGLMALVGDLDAGGPP
jgi:hypothetical protein